MMLESEARADAEGDPMQGLGRIMGIGFGAVIGDAKGFFV